MDPRREQELLKVLPFGMDRPVTLADGLPIRFERIIGFTLLIATYVLLTCLPFAIVFLVLGRTAPDGAQAALWSILGKSFGALWVGSVVWMLIWFVVYVVLDLKDANSLGRVPGLNTVGDEAEEEESMPVRSASSA